MERQERDRDGDSDEDEEFGFITPTTLPLVAQHTAVLGGGEEEAGLGLRGDDAGYHEEEAASFQESVMAEENSKKKALETITIATKSRADSGADLYGVGTGTGTGTGGGMIMCGSPEKCCTSPPTSSSFLAASDDHKSQLFDARPLSLPHMDKYHRVIISAPEDEGVDADTAHACSLLEKCMAIREKWLKDHQLGDEEAAEAGMEMLSPPEVVMRRVRDGENSYWRREEPIFNIFDRKIPPTTDNFEFNMVNGVTEVMYHGRQVFRVMSLQDFIDDFVTVRNAIYAGPVKTYSYQRLEILFAKFNLHCLLNETRENECTKCVPHRDFYNVRKVDTHVHHSACMVQKHLLRFIKSKLKNSPDEVVVYRDGKFLTLAEVFKSLRLTAYDLSIDTLDMHASNTFHRFDKFNLKYNPAGQSRLREIFLKTDNVIGGKYLAEITQEVMKDLDAAKYQMVEWRISIYGRKLSEWANLGQWFYVNRLAHPNVRWLIQIPRLYELYRKAGEVTSFAEMLTNIFAPLFEVSVNPTSNVPLFCLLENVVGFDSVDDESRPENNHLSNNENLPSPEEWNTPRNPPYGYWIYYMYANICVLNKLRATRGLSTFQFRPHCGEAGDYDHLISTYILANQVNHAILLRKLPALQYLYYLSQVGIAMSPLSNNKLFLDYNKNPFPKYFKQGMNVSLSTDDPLMLHFTKDPLVEEYSVATQVWKLSSTDQCEIARNSVLQSGWEDVFKRHFLGPDYMDIDMTNVPLIRLRYRDETLAEEKSLVTKNAAEKKKQAKK